MIGYGLDSLGLSLIRDSKTFLFNITAFKMFVTLTQVTYTTAAIKAIA